MVKSFSIIVKQMFLKVKQVACANRKGIKNNTPNPSPSLYVYGKSMQTVCSKNDAKNIETHPNWRRKGSQQQLQINQTRGANKLEEKQLRGESLGEPQAPRTLQFKRLPAKHCRKTTLKKTNFRN